MASLPAHLAQLDRRARLAEPALRDWFQSLAGSLRQAVPVAAVAEAIRTGNLVPLASILHAVTVPAPDLRELIEQEARAALRLVTDRLPPGQRIDLRFDIRDPRFERVADELGGRLIREVPASTRTAVNRVVGTAYRQGVHPYDFAPQIRATVGLTERQAVGVLNYATRLTARGAETAFVQKASVAYADRLLRQRSILIARTETLRAANLSRIEGFRAAGDAGLVEQTARLVWVAAGDQRVCPECQALDGAEATLDNPIFDGTTPPPPQHPDCRCIVDLL